MKKETRKKISLLVFLAKKNIKLETWLLSNNIETEKRMLDYCEMIGVTPPHWTDIHAYMESYRTSVAQAEAARQRAIESENIVDNSKILNDAQEAKTIVAVAAPQDTPLEAEMRRGDETIPTNESAHPEESSMNVSDEQPSKTVALIQGRRLDKNRKGK